MYNGPSGPRRLLTMTVSPANNAVANIAPTAMQITLLVLILIPFRLAKDRRSSEIHKEGNEGNKELRDPK
jgi:hypothetical protein